MALSHLPGPVLNPAPGHVQLLPINILHHDNFLAPRQLCTPVTHYVRTGQARHCASAFSELCLPGLFPGRLSNLYRDPRHSLRSHGASAPALKKIRTRTAKSTPYLSCHRDYFLAKVPGLVSADGATNVYSLNRRAVRRQRGRKRIACLYSRILL
jgi:hypothetical protein